MKIHPKADNAIVIELEDGSTFELHETEVSSEYRLYIAPAAHFLRVSERFGLNGLDWKPIITTRHNIMLTIKEN